MEDVKADKLQQNKAATIIIIVLSTVVPLAVAALLMFPEVFSADLGIDRGLLPRVHAIINGTTAVLLLLGLWFIKAQKIVLHRAMMVSAFALSALFLVSYVLSKINADPIPYGGEGFVRYLYFFILISHILLSIPVLPLAMFAIYWGFTGAYKRHRKVVRWTFPIWLYVAVTGVLVYLFMQSYY
jgi:putative membrane protein